MTIFGIATGARLNAGIELDGWLDRFQAAKCDAIRLSAHWQKVEPNIGGGYDWSVQDEIVSKCESHNIGVVLEAGVRDTNLYATGKPAAFVKFAAALAQRYEGRILATAGPNEPNHVKTDPVPSAANYTNLILKPSYDAIKKVAPSVVVLTGGMGGAKNDANDGDAADFVDKIYQLGGRGYFDALAFHPYSRGSFSWVDALKDPKQGAYRLVKAHKTMRAYGDSKMQIWITENGWPTGGNRNAVTEAKQTSLLMEWVSWSKMKPWVGPLFWFDHVDDVTADPNNQGDWMGLWKVDNTPKASLAAFTSLHA